MLEGDGGYNIGQMAYFFEEPEGACGHRRSGERRAPLLFDPRLSPSRPGVRAEPAPGVQRPGLTPFSVPAPMRVRLPILAPS
jgi:hypothetical protein